MLRIQLLLCLTAFASASRLMRRELESEEKADIICINWFGNNLDWDNIPFESMAPWGFTPEGCTEALVEPYGEYSCATYDYSDDAAQRIRTCNGDCFDGVCVDGYATQEPTILCSLGHVQIGTDCEACDPGNYNANVGGVCSACPEGTFASQAGSATCTPCEVGFIAPNAGSQYCEACKVGYTTDGYGQAECVLDITEEPTMEPTVEAASKPVCINWFGNNLDWDSMPFEGLSDMSPWGFTPEGCTEALVEPYGEYHCAIYDAAGQGIQSCNGDCFDGNCVDGYAITTDIVTEKTSLTPTMDPTEHTTTTYEPACVGVEQSTPEEKRKYSSTWDDDAIGTGHAQSMIDSPQAWSARNNAAGEYLTITLALESQVIGVVTQGRHGGYNQWVTSYYIQTSIDGVTFEDYNGGQVFAANSDADTKVYHEFGTAVDAQYVRFVVKDWAGHISMRADVLICDNDFPSSAPTLMQTTDFVSAHPSRSPTLMQTTDFVSAYPTRSPSVAPTSAPTMDVTKQEDIIVTYDQTKKTCHNADQKISQPCNGGRGTGCSFDDCTLHCLAEPECNFFFHITSRSGCILYRSCDVTRKAYYAGTTVEIVRY